MIYLIVLWVILKITPLVDWGKEVSSQQLASSVSRVKYVLTVMLFDESEYNMSVIRLLSTLAFSAMVENTSKTFIIHNNYLRLFFHQKTNYICTVDLARSYIHINFCIFIVFCISCIYRCTNSVCPYTHKLKSKQQTSPIPAPVTGIWMKVEDFHFS